MRKFSNLRPLVLSGVRVNATFRSIYTTAAGEIVMSEQKFAIGVLKIANQNPNGIATYDECWEQIGNFVAITQSESRLSKTRNGEPMWHQKIRNIKSHSDNPGNFVYEGYLEHVEETGFKITPTGKNYLIGK